MISVHPKLVDSVYAQIFDQVWINGQPVIAVGGANLFFLPRLAQPVFFTHNAVDFFVIYAQDLAMHLFGDTAISIFGKVQAKLLDTIYQCFI